MHPHRILFSLACAFVMHTPASIAQPFPTLPPSPLRDPSAPTAEMSPAAAPRIIVDSNAACMLKINGHNDDAVLMPGKPRIVDVAPGDVAIECTSTTAPGVGVRQTAAATASTASLTVLLDVATAIVKATCSNQPATLVDLGHGVLRHCVTGVDWTRDDSGPGGLVYAAARDYCARLGKGWEIPLADELIELIDRSGKSRTQCGQHTCYVSPHFRFTGPSFWSDTKTHERMHMGVLLMQGGHHPIADDDNFDYHTLCVRRPGAG